MPPLDVAVILPTGGAVIIGGVTIPMAAVDQLGEAVKSILLGVYLKQPPEQIAASLEPMAIPVIEEAAAILFPPFGGTIVEILILVLSKSKAFADWTPEEQQRWWDRAQGQS